MRGYGFLDRQGRGTVSESLGSHSHATIENEHS